MSFLFRQCCRPLLYYCDKWPVVESMVSNGQIKFVKCCSIYFVKALSFIESLRLNTEAIKWRNTRTDDFTVNFDL